MSPNVTGYSRSSEVIIVERHTRQLSGSANQIVPV